MPAKAVELKAELPEFMSINGEIEKHDNWGYLERGKDRAGMWGRRLSALGQQYVMDEVPPGRGSH